MIRRFIIILICTLPILKITAQPKHEIRAAWLTTAYGLDWPKEKANSPEGIKRQKDELRHILDELKTANFNTILFQTRIRGDVIYPSNIEPYSSALTGKSGKNPGYDPLAFAIEECHKRGMEFHAWVVAIPLGRANHVRSLGKSSVTKRKPAICKQYKGEWFLDPGNPGTKEYLSSIIKEIVNGYDVDGIHLDYIRYSDRPANFPDKNTFKKYGKGKTLNNWRRDNITSIVRYIYHDVKAVKPWVKVSSSPVGKFKDTSRYSSYGWNAYNTVFQDAQGWLREGIHDILFPMMYFNGNQFYPFALDWKEKCFKRHVVPGLGIYFLHPSEKNWPLEDIERQINFTRSQKMAGQAYYRTQFLIDNTKGLLDQLNSNHYIYPAVTPAMTWMDNIPPSSPSHLKKEDKDGDYFLSWQPSVDNDTRIKPYYTIYASNTYPVDPSNPAHIIATRVRETSYLYSPIYPGDKKRYFAVTASDRYGNESECSQFDIPENTTFLFYDDNITYLPIIPNAAYVTITDITGRAVLSCPYDKELLLPKLEKGHYKVLVTDKMERIIYQGAVNK